MIEFGKGGEAIVILVEMVDFQECLQICMLEQMSRSGQNYTWDDKGSMNRIFSKIDQSFTNGEWMDEMSDCRTTFLNEGVSDHCPIHMKLFRLVAK